LIFDAPYIVLKLLSKIGEIALTKPSDRFERYAAERRYLPHDFWLLKAVFATGAIVFYRFRSRVFVNESMSAKSK
jgi:type IV secretory pathway protease TraF